MRRMMMAAVVAVLLCSGLYGATRQGRYYAHETVEDGNGVIGPWYQGQNGQCDLRVRIAAETMKRYPWTDTAKAAAAVPEYVFSGAWKIADDGTISIPPIDDWANGDLGQRAAYVLGGLVDYYRYSGDAAGIANMTMMADALLDHCLTPEDHPWPRFLVSVPVKGKPYGQADAHGFIQLDIVAEVGVPLIQASQITGNQRWFEAAKHWGDLLAEKRDRQPGVPPWGRYANPEDVPWEDQMTGGVAFLLDFFDALIRAGYTGKDNAIVEARQAGVAYLRDVLLPDWTGQETWGRNYWDWPCPVQVENVTEFAARYVMAHPEEFPNWRNDARNIMTLFLNRTGVAPGSNGDVFSGAWAYPESAGCCGRSLWYGPMELANVYAQYGALADSAWGREMGRRQIILSTYDVHETGVVEDNIDGGQIVAGSWFKIAHPMALKHSLAAMAWLPEVLGASRESHIMRSSGVVEHVVYFKNSVWFQVHDAPGPTVSVLRLAGPPMAVASESVRLEARNDAGQNGYQVKPLPDGDYLVTIRHDGLDTVGVRFDDPQAIVYSAGFGYTGPWAEVADAHLDGGACRAASQKGAAAMSSFKGNQVRLLGSVGPKGGLAEVYLDDVKQLVGIDGWNPTPRSHQLLYYRNGLSNGQHTLKVVVKGEGNPRAQGAEVVIDSIQFSDATPKTGKAGFGEGGGPTDAQRSIFGYAGREDYMDAKGNAWRPGTEFVIRAGGMVDSVPASWWRQRRRLQIAGTDDPELYRYGIHGPEFWTDFTVGPGRYHVRLKFAETRRIEPAKRIMTISINGQEKVRDLNLAATANQGGETRSLAHPDKPQEVSAGFNRAVDLVFNGIEPEHGVISIRFKGSAGGEAMVQAIEVGPGDGGEGAKPVSLATAPAGDQASQAMALALPGDVKLEFVLIKAGKFLMGAPEDEPDREIDEGRHEVTLTRDYWLGKCEVTNRQFRAFRPDHVSRALGNEKGDFNGEDQPVVAVELADAEAFCRWALEKTGRKVRLPTEAEWEYACRAGGKAAYSFGDERGQLAEYGWYAGNSGGVSHPVGRKRPNAWGLYDMHGNVAEWVADWYTYYPGGAQTDPQGPPSSGSHCWRECSWSSQPFECRCATRDYAVPTYKSAALGFRVACDP